MLCAPCFARRASCQRRALQRSFVFSVLPVCFLPQSLSDFGLAVCGSLSQCREERRTCSFRHRLFGRSGKSPLPAAYQLSQIFAAFPTLLPKLAKPLTMKEIMMSMYNYAKRSKFESAIKQMQDAEVNGSELYFVLVYLAREHGLHDLAEAMLKNASEDSVHGGMYGAMLGKGKETVDELWKQAVRLYKVEATAQSKLQKMADEMRSAGEPELAKCVEATIEEENEHARRLKAVFDAHGIAY